MDHKIFNLSTSINFLESLFLQIALLKYVPLYLNKYFLKLYAQDNYLDAYLRVIRATDPTRTALVFSCGMGAVRTTFAMVAASLVRRKQLMSMGLPDPYTIKTPAGNGITGSSTPIGTVSLYKVYHIANLSHQRNLLAPESSKLLLL